MPNPTTILRRIRDQLRQAARASRKQIARGLSCQCAHYEDGKADAHNEDASIINNEIRKMEAET